MSGLFSQIDGPGASGRQDFPLAEMPDVAGPPGAARHIVARIAGTL